MKEEMYSSLQNERKHLYLIRFAWFDNFIRISWEMRFLLWVHPWHVDPANSAQRLSSIDIGFCPFPPRTVSSYPSSSYYFYYYCWAGGLGLNGLRSSKVRMGHSFWDPQFDIFFFKKSKSKWQNHSLKYHFISFLFSNQKHALGQIIFKASIKYFHFLFFFWGVFMQL